MMKLPACIAWATLLCAAPSVAQDNSSPVMSALPPAATIAVEGDSIAYGLDASNEGQQAPINGSGQPRSRQPFPEALHTILQSCGSTTNRGYPGDRSVDGLVRWQNAPKTDLTILMYGGNDALNSARASSGTVSPETYRFVLSELIARRKRQGGSVLVMTATPLQNPIANKAIQPYRDGAREIAAKEMVPFFDSAKFFGDARDLWIDGVHLNQAASLKLARALARHIRCSG